MARKIDLCCLIASLVLGGGVARSQSPAPAWLVGYVLPTNNNFTALSPGDQIPFPPTSVSASTTAVVVVGNRGNASGSLNSVIVSGSAFQLTGLPPLPATLDSGKQLNLGVIFAPTQAGTYTGTLSLGFSDGTTYLVQLSGTTAAPSFKLTYYFQTNGNVNSVDNGGTITFPLTKVTGSSTAVMTVANFGTGAGNIKAVTLAGSDFQLQGVSLLPVLVTSGKGLQFSVVYSPTALGPSTGTLSVQLDDRTLVVNLAGTSSGPQYTYTAANNAPLVPGQTFALADTPLGQTTSLTIQIANSGNASGTIGGIAVSGQGFQLSSVPILPFVLAPNATAQFNLNFTPAQPGTTTGYLQIGADVFTLTGTANGTRLVYTYVAGATPVTIQTGGNVLAGSLQIGQTSQIQFVVNNQGNLPATVSNVAVASAKSAFSLSGLPGLPATIAPGDQLTLSIVFTPAALGDNTAQLRLDAAAFNLIGSGTPPTALPAVTISGLDAPAGPAQQPAVSLNLAAPYPLPLSGTLTLAVNSSTFAADPAVQFATGGRTVAFTIPAGTTQAQFPAGSSIRLQTGTVASTISVAATFATNTGVDVTPASAPATSFQIPAGPPQALSIQLGSTATSAFTIVVTGFSTTRSLTKLDLDFVPTTSYKLPATHFTIDISAAAASWYRTAESQTYGSLFTAAVPFTFQPPNSSFTLGQLLQSVSATLTNEIGQSNSVSFTPQPQP